MDKNNNIIILKLTQKKNLDFGQILEWEDTDGSDILFEVFTTRKFLSWEELSALERIIFCETNHRSFCGIGVLPDDWRASFWLSKRLNLRLVTLGKIQDFDGIPVFNKESQTHASLAVELEDTNISAQLKNVLDKIDYLIVSKKNWAKLEATGLISKLKVKIIVKEK